MVSKLNWRGIAFCLLVIVVCYGAVWLITSDVHAEENGSYVLVEDLDNFYSNTTKVSSNVTNYTEPSFVVLGNESTAPEWMKNISQVVFANGTVLNLTSSEPAARIPYGNGTRIGQGQCVEVGGVYDVSGVIGFTFSTKHNNFAYYGRYEDSFQPENWTPEYKYELPDDRDSYYNFYLDPEIFSTRLGYWYQYNGLYERSANKRAFYVSDRCIATASNATESRAEENATPVLLNPRVIEPHYSGYDIVVSSDDDLIIDRNYGDSKLWVFGKTQSIYDRRVNVSNSTPLLSYDDIKSLPDGEYTIVLQGAGKNGIYDIGYEVNTRGTARNESLVPALRSIPTIDITGSQEPMKRDALVSFIRDKSDDNLATMSMMIQSPSVMIDGYQEIQVNENIGWLEVAGYTNKIGGTPITLYIDRNPQTGKSIKYPAMTISANATTSGVYRTFHGFIPLYYNNLAPGLHNLTAVLPSGRYAEVDFYIMQDLAPHYQQPKYYKFVDGHPYIPDPEPIIIEKEVIREVTKVEYKTIIEKEPVDYDTLAWSVITRLVAPAIAVIVFVGIPVAYLITVVARAFAERRTRKSQEETNGDN